MRLDDNKVSKVLPASVDGLSRLPRTPPAGTGKFDDGMMELAALIGALLICAVISVIVLCVLWWAAP